MKLRPSQFFLPALMLVAGCAPQAAEPQAPVVDEAAVRREELFGAEAKGDGIQWRSSGLGIKVLTPGEGAPPQMNDTVRVHYVGRLKDGRVFDDSRARGQPSDFVVKGLITGWAAAMPALRPGGRAIFFIPPALGYGGLRTAVIPPNSGLIFDVELLAVNPGAAGAK